MSPATTLLSLPPTAARIRSGLRRAIVACGLLCIAASAASAQDVGGEDADRFARKGFLGAAYVIGFDDFETLEGSIGNTGAAHGFSFWVGYRWNQWLASVARGEFVRGFETGFNGDDTDTELASGTLGARVYPLASLSKGWDDRIEPYAEVTIGLGNVEQDLSLNVETKETNFVSRFALGFDVWITDSLGLTFASAYWLPVGDLTEFRYYSGNAGIQYRF